MMLKLDITHFMGFPITQWLCIVILFKLAKPNRYINWRALLTIYFTVFNLNCINCL